MIKVDQAFLPVTVTDMIGRTKSQEVGDWYPTTAGGWVASVSGNQQYLLEGLLPDDSNIIMSGKAKRAHKSWLAHVLCMSLSTGISIGPLNPVHKNGIPVWYISAEGSKFGTKNRWLMLNKGLNVPYNSEKLFFTHREPIVLSDKAWVRRIKSVIMEKRIRLLVLDPLVMFIKGDENSVEDMSEAMRTLNEFRSVGASVMFIHHLRKSQRDWNPDPDEDIRGTSALAGFYDQHWAIRQAVDNETYNDLIIRSKDDEGMLYKLKWHILKEEGTANFSMSERTAEERWKELQDTILSMILSSWEYTKARLVEIAVKEGSLEEKEAERMVADFINNGKLVPLSKSTWTKAKLK